MYSLIRRAGTVVLPSSSTVAGTVTLIVRSRLVAVTRSPSSTVSSRTLLSTGSVDRGDTARETSPRAEPRAAGETEAFMEVDSFDSVAVVTRRLLLRRHDSS